MIVEDFAEAGEETHIWVGDDLIFEGEYQKENPYKKRKVLCVGYEEEIGSEPLREFRSIYLDE